MADFEKEFASIRGELTLLKWMVGFNLALTVAVLLRLPLSGT